MPPLASSSSAAATSSATATAAASSNNPYSVSARLRDLYGLTPRAYVAATAAASPLLMDGSEAFSQGVTQQQKEEEIESDDDGQKRYLPPFIEDKPLKDAIREANGAAKYLFVYLHAGDHEDTSDFIQNVLSDKQCVSTIEKDVGGLLYLVDAYSKEGAQLEQSWSVSQFPYVACLVKGRVVGDIQGRFTADDFLDFLTACDEVARPVIHQEVAFIYERNMRERLRLQHEEEMREAERIDREKLSKAKLAEEERKRAIAEQERLEAIAKKEEAERAERAERERREAEEKALALETEKAAAASALPDEPADTEDASKIAKIRLVDLKGKATNRNFYRNDTVADLYRYARTVEGYSGGPFALISGFPPRAIVSEEEANATKVLIGDVPALVPRSVVTMKPL